MLPSQTGESASAESVPERSLWAGSTCSEQPTLAPILALHRHDDGYIAFAVARDAAEDFRPLISVRRDELARYFPEFRRQLLKDAYVSINADWRLQRYGKEGPAYGHPLHRTDRLRYLCAAYADLDYYRLGVNFSQALGKVVEMQDAGALPKASIIVKSGRGMWLVYLLHDPNDTTRAPRAFPEKLALYFRLQKAIVERLAAVGADPCGKDATRYIRVPGSLHSGSEQHAQWWIQGEGPRAYSYSLAELCQLFGVEAPQRHVRERAAIDSETSDMKRRGWVALNARRLRDFNLLRSLRGGFEKGCRSYAALLYAHLLRTNGVPRNDAANHVNTMGRECHPPLTPSQCRDALRSGFTRKRWVRITDQTIADWLGITPDESAVLDKFPPASRFKPANPGPPEPSPSEQQKALILARRCKIAQIIAEVDAVPALRDMGQRLIDAGFSGNHQTVAKDYMALGIRSKRTRGARAEEKSKQLVLSGI